MTKQDVFLRLREILIQDALESMKDSGPYYEKERDNLIRIIENITTTGAAIKELATGYPKTTLTAVVDCLAKEAA